MTICDVSVVLGAGLLACPSDCPYWSQNAVWKGVGVCTTKERCSIYNPLLSYADDKLKVCLPCAVYGCSSCAYSGTSVSASDSDSLPLPDVCLECAPGYRMDDDGHDCYLVESSLWSRSFYALVAAAIVVFFGLCLRMLLRPSQLEANMARYWDVMESHKVGNGSDSLNNGVFAKLFDLLYLDVAGVGVTLYFRFLLFMAATIVAMIMFTLAHAHIPCSDMIRPFKKAFSLDKQQELSSAKSWVDFFKPSDELTLKDRVLNFKYVDDAIEWSVSQYADDTANAIRALYLCIMGTTIVFALYQRNFLQKHFNNRSRVQDFTLILERVPPLHSLDEFVEGATGVRPKSVAVAYDLQRSPKGINEFLNTVDDEHLGGVYVNLDMTDEHRKILNGLQPSGIAFAVFSTRKEMQHARETLEHNGICDVKACDLEPEDIVWPNLLNRDSLFARAVGITAGICATQLLWTFVFFLPYAAYKLHSDSSDFFESMWLSWFAGLGNSLVGTTIHVATDKIGFASRESSECYLMWVSAAMHIINVGLNLMLAHLINYGGRYKIVAMVKDFGLYMTTPTFRVGEEVSISQSLNGFMKNVLLSVPFMALVLAHYAVPLLKLLFVLSADLGETETSRLMRAQRFDLSGRYCTAVVYFTSAQLLQFVIDSKPQAVKLALCLLASSLLHYVSDAYTLLYKAAPTRIPGYAAFYNALMLWSVPTGLLAACPSYWRWRGANGRVSTIFIVFAIHVILYNMLMRSIFGKKRHFDIMEVNNSPSDYTTGNPVYTLRRLVQF
ncbi:hypothetical protein BaOVIS_003770 [Babesia ovis]|uniref:Uncharacterized protein n=1 Tax=Babesia ovis TaxID=5869 RepID=A0A9W5T892_BABOV|nr:hypothetical protein BaOVIS_003770 [Babesia ovis]